MALKPMERLFASAAALALLTACGGSETSGDVSNGEEKAAVEAAQPIKPIKRDWNKILAAFDAEDREDAEDDLKDAEEDRERAQEERQRAEEHRERVKDWESRLKEARKDGDAEAADRAEQNLAAAKERVVSTLQRAQDREASAIRREVRIAEKSARLREDWDEYRRVRQEAMELGAPPTDFFGVESFKIVYQHEGMVTGTTTLYVDDWGDTLGMETDTTTPSGPDKMLYLWKDRRAYAQNLVRGDSWDTGVRMKDTEPSAFGIETEKNLERIGYERVGDKTIAGVTCEHWRNANLKTEGCRRDRIDFEFVNGVMGPNAGLKKTAVTYEEGVAVPAELLALQQSAN